MSAVADKYVSLEAWETDGAERKPPSGGVGGHECVKHENIIDLTGRLIPGESYLDMIAGRAQ
ncbi:MAG: hypothetical protein A2W19_13290 [Spirochaetes bacterium RBG_16_49_21]|nr:MAG: hypothetical protein A2W19_13290 [Spirochaetes bacterium RBG_16_49_21]